MAYTNEQIYKAGADIISAGGTNADVMAGAKKLGMTSGDLIAAYQSQRPDLFAQSDEIMANVNAGNTGGNAANPEYKAYAAMNDYVRTNWPTGGAGGGGMVNTPPPGSRIGVTAGTQYGPYDSPLTNQRVNESDATIEGRIQNGLLKTDARGNYTNQVVRQAVDRSDQRFNQRGLLNSSMAVQGGQEAAISKAIEIAAPDAQRVFEQDRANQNAQNTFAQDRLGREHTSSEKALDRAQADAVRADTQSYDARGDYRTAVASIGTNYQRQLDTINASAMSPQDKSTAIAQATAVRDGEIAYTNNVYSRMPNWKSEWLSAAVPTGGVDVNQIGSIDALQSIANDPAQPEATRSAARQRIAMLAAQAPAPTPAPSSGGSGMVNGGYTPGESGGD